MAITFTRGKAGGGGWVMDIIISPDGLTRIHRCDVYTPYIWDSTIGAAGEWYPLINPTSMPSPYNTLGGNQSGRGYGCYAIDVSRSNSSILYMVAPGLAGFNSTVFKSTNRGSTWSVCAGFTPVEMAVQSSYRMHGHKAMIHPTDPDIFITTTNAGAAYRTTDGGANFTQISGLPSGTDPCIQFDHSNGNICYLGWRTGNNRLWKSTDAGATFSQMTGGPDNIKRITSAIDGTIYMTEYPVGTNNAHRLIGTTFVNLSTKGIGGAAGGWHSIACDPLDANHVTFGYDAGNLNTSTDGGETWSGFYASAAIRESSADIQWLEWTKEDYMSNGSMAYDPITANRLWYAHGIGVAYTTPPAGATQPTWTYQTRGNDELIVDDMKWPPGGRPFMTVQDRGIFKLDSFTTYPSTHGPGRTTSLQHATGMDYASSDPNFIAVACLGGPAHFYSTDAGATYNAFSPQPTGVGGAFAVLTPLKMVFSPSNNGFVQYTTDGGANWTLSTFPVDVPTSGESGFGYTWTLNLKYVAADRVNSIYYAYNYKTGDMYKSTDDGANFTKTADGVGSPNSLGDGQLLIAVPGQAGHVFLTSGSIYGDTALRRSNNADSASATWTDVSNTSAAWAVGFSAPAPGQSYPAILMSGKANGDTLPGIYISTDNCVTWTLLSNGPANSIDVTRAIAGNPDTYGEFVIGGAAGYIYTADSGAPPVALTSPTISGSTAVGSVLTGVVGTYSGSGVTITHQWRRDGANISGQTGTTYTTQSADIGHVIDWYELATNSDGTANQNSNDITVVAASSGGGYAPPIKVKHEKQRRELQKKNQEAIEQTIRLAYQRLTGKVTEPPILQQEATPERLAVHAEKLAKQLVEKSKNSAKQRERNKAIIADLHRQAAAIMQEEEEAIIMLLH